MSILFGILLYTLCIAGLCALTGFNRLDGSEPDTRRAQDLAPAGELGPAGRVPAREAHG